MRKFDHTKRLLILSVVMVCLILVQVPVISQTPRVGNRQQGRPANTPARPQQARRSLDEKARQLLKALRPERGRAMADALRRGKLPEPARLPQGNIDQQAATLAKAVSAGDESSTAALYAAILAAGYGVRDTDGSVLQTTERQQGLVFRASEVAATAKLYGEDYGVMLSHLSEAFVQSVPELKNVPLATVILNAIRKSANSNNPAVRFWGRFIVELGRNAPVPNDLLGTVDPKKTRMDAIQVSLLLSRLAADLAVSDKRTAQLRQTNYAHARSMIVKRDIEPTHEPPSIQTTCDTTDVQDLILDWSAIGSTTTFAEILNTLGGRALVIGKLLGIANTVAVVLKFIASYALLKVEISMDAEYLVRTSDKSPGTFQTLTAKVEIDDTPWPDMKCLRPLMNALGLDVELPKSGPIEDVAVFWQVEKGGNPTGLAAIEDLIHDDAYPDAIFFLKAEPDAEDLRMQRQRTDSNGVTRVEVWGLPQKEDLSKKKLFEVWKGAGVSVGVQLKSMKIRNLTAALSTLGDIVENIVSFLTGDRVGGAFGVLSETMYRSQWYSSKPFFFLVKDWEPCRDHWQGTITYSTTFEDEGTAENIANRSQWSDAAYYEAKAEISGKRDNLGAPWARVTATARQIRSRTSSGKGVCYRVSTQVQDIQGTDSVTTTGFSITIDPRTRRYNVSPPLIVVQASGTETLTSEVKGTCNNPFNKSIPPNAKPVTGLTLDADGPTLQGVGYIDPNNPDQISGTDKAVHSTVRGKRVTTITWDLTRCKDQ